MKTVLPKTLALFGALLLAGASQADVRVGPTNLSPESGERRVQLELENVGDSLELAQLTVFRQIGSDAKSLEATSAIALSDRKVNLPPGTKTKIEVKIKKSAAKGCYRVIVDVAPRKKKGDAVALAFRHSIPLCIR